MFFISTYLNGLWLGAGLIIAIGAQSAHVLRMGLLRQYIGLTVAICIVIDIALTTLGVAGMGAVLRNSAPLMAAARWGGAAFLLVYAWRSWRAVWTYATQAQAERQLRLSVGQAVSTVLALSLLNPHVYLDTVVLLGAIGSQFPIVERPSFVLGAATASVLWFGGLGYGASRMSGRLSRPRSGRYLDALTGSIMLSLALSLLWRA